jgi:hypothetical protein
MNFKQMIRIPKIILQAITRHYLESGNFNGISLEKLQKIIGISQNELIIELIPLIYEGKISINFGDRHPNPDIKALDPEPNLKQIVKINNCNFRHACAYPEKKHLSTVIDSQQYRDRPFTLRLALGESQLSFLSFDLNVLESYRNDPRYHYSNDDIHGQIGLTDEVFHAGSVRESDQILLESFSFSYDTKLNRAAAAFLIYLSRLTPEHQQIWRAKLLDGEYFLHPEYILSSFGHFPENESVFNAFIQELQIINKMCVAMKKPPIFRTDFTNSGKPKEFSFLIRPTEKEFQDFVQLLDKMLSDNINKDFFKGELPLEEEIERGDGKIEVRKKGTIILLNEWVRKHFRLKDPQDLDDMIKCFREVRKLRQRPAHALDNNNFDQAIYQKQRDLIFNAYTNVRLLRLILANHPRCKRVEIPDWLYLGKISPF